MTTTKKAAAKKPAFNLAAWLADSDDFSHLDVDVYLSPRYKEWVSAKREFDALSEVLLGRDESQDSSTLGEPDAQQERLEELHALLGELSPLVKESRKTLRFVDATTQRDLNKIDAKYRNGEELDTEGMFFELLERFGLFDGKALSLEEWENLARRTGVWQWKLIQGECMEYLGRAGEVAPDFSLPSLPSIPE